MKKSIFQGSSALIFLFLETLFYGIDFGLLSILVVPFYNKVVFGKPPGGSKGVATMAYSDLIAWAGGIMHHAIIGTLAFCYCSSSIGMPFFWTLELLIGAGLLRACTGSRIRMPCCWFCTSLYMNYFPYRCPFGLFNPYRRQTVGGFPDCVRAPNKTRTLSKPPFL